jgi:hypothetical protein
MITPAASSVLMGFIQPQPYPSSGTPKNIMGFSGSLMLVTIHRGHGTIEERL